MLACPRALEQRLGMSRLVEQHFEWRHVVVPLDQRRTRTEPGERFLVERPHVGGNARAVIIDSQRESILELMHRVASQMNLADGLDRQRSEIGGGVPAVVAA